MKKMDTTRTAIAVATSVMLGAQLATQRLAHVFGYQQALGTPLFEFGGYPCYAPWKIAEWAIAWPQYSQDFTQAGSMGVMATTISLVAILKLKSIAAHTSTASGKLHGTARWATKEDIVKAGLLPPDRSMLEVVTAKAPASPNGVYVGGWLSDNGEFYYLRHSGPEHVLTYAPTRSGKGVGLVIPTLLSWPASAVITDLKGELWALTAGWRATEERTVIRFEPAEPGWASWNPLSEIRLGGSQEIGDAQNLAQMLVDPDGRGLNDHWSKTSYSLLTGVILFALEQDKSASLADVDAILSNPGKLDKGGCRLWLDMMSSENEIIKRTGADMHNRPEKEAGSVLSTALSFLSLYRDPVVAANTAKSDFRVRDLMHGEQPASLYIVTQPNDKARLRPLVRLMINMIVRLLADKMEFKGGRTVLSGHRLLMMLDEFPSLGKMEILQESLAFVAGYGIKCYLICQDLNQLKSKELGYGQDETITSNCHVQNAYPPNRIETAEHLSKLTGQATVIQEKVSLSGRRSSFLLSNVSRELVEHQRPLLTPDECMRMKGPQKNTIGEITEPGEMVIYVAGYPAIKGCQALYFKDPEFVRRSQIDAPGPASSTVTQ